CQRERIRPATYPPTMKAPICAAIAQKTAKEAMTLAETPEFGQGEVAERPMAAPKVRSTKVIAAARAAPARTAPHSTKLAPGVDAALELAGAGPTRVMTFLSNSVVSEAQGGSRRIGRRQQG